jgi:hypothetical protein
MSYDSFTANVEGHIAATGQSVIGVFGDGISPTFSYTIGRTDRGKPELIAVGLPPATAQAIFNSINDGMEPETVGEVIEGVANFPLRLGAVSDAAIDEYMVQAVARQERVAGPRPAALQVVYPDPEGRYPGDEGYSLPPELQPVLAPEAN